MPISRKIESHYHQRNCQSFPLSPRPTYGSGKRIFQNKPAILSWRNLLSEKKRVNWTKFPDATTYSLRKLTQWSNEQIAPISQLIVRRSISKGKVLLKRWQLEWEIYFVFHVFLRHVLCKMESKTFLSSKIGLTR